MLGGQPSLHDRNHPIPGHGVPARPRNLVKKTPTEKTQKLFTGTEQYLAYHAAQPQAKSYCKLRWLTAR